MDELRFFSTTDDRIDLSNMGAITDFTDLQTNHLSEVNGNAVISIGPNDFTILVGVSSNALTSDDFIF